MEEKLSNDPNIVNIRQRGRDDVYDCRKENYYRLLVEKRRLNSDTLDVEEATPTKVKEVSSKLKKAKTVEDVKWLSNVFCQDEKHIASFLGVDGALYGLISCLTGSSTELQSEAVACFVNLLTGPHNGTKKTIKAAAPYLITYLSGSNPSLQHLGAWALANAASDCKSCSRLLKAQGMLVALVPLLESSNDCVVWSSVRALASFISTTESDDWTDIVNVNTLQVLRRLLVENKRDEVPEMIASILFHLSPHESFDDLFLQTDFINVLVQKLNVAVTKPEYIQLTTQILRTLGNLSAASENVIAVVVNVAEVDATVALLLGSSHLHVLVETAWMLANISGTMCGSTWLARDELLALIVQHINAMGDLGIQVLRCLCNCACHNVHCRRYLSVNGTTQKLMSNLRRPENEMLSLSLALLQILVTCDETQMTNASPDWRTMSAEIVTVLRNLQFHGSPYVQEQAVQLLKLFDDCAK